MKTLKPICATIDPIAVAEFLNEKYGFNCNVRLLKAGVNHSYLVSNIDQKFVFRIYSFNWRSLTEIKAEVDYLNLLKENRIPISYPISDSEGKFICNINAVEGLRYGVLFSYAKGEKLLTYSEDLHFRTGQIMAKMHKVGMDKYIDRISYNADNLLTDTFNYLPNFLPEDTDQYQFLSKLSVYLKQAISYAKVEELRKGVVHLDVWFDNMNIDGNDITIFDFDFCGNGWLIYDLAYYIMQIHSTEVSTADYELKVSSFLNGYESITKISTEERRLLPVLGLAIYVFYVGVQCKRFDDWSNVFLNEMHLKRLIDLRIKRWFDFNKLAF
ncbi:phosphotransferase [Pedobacter namyangjuensis]|uniref:phosphotransferase n=1 Tax=Pedobacter namyangjuensis TaxID=600626 RepID=UPI000DE4139A|nr:phosphotransferase [Pedobacter namyangjuensis]